MRAFVMKCRLAFHMVYGFVLAVILWPMLSPWARVGMERWWAKKLLRIMHIEVDVEFECPEADYSSHGGSALLFSNHVSWLDIFAFNAHHPVTFIAKSEISSWPIAGLFAKRSGTLFIERGKRTAVRDVIEAAVGVLKTGRTVAVFPEGTTGPGDSPLHFHSNFVQPAMKAEVPLIPVSLQYFTPDGQFTTEPAFLGEQTLMENLQVLYASNTGFHVKLFFHTPIMPNPAVDRRTLSAQAFEVIKAHCERVARH